ncbi:serine hydrolase domain-containing protein [Mycolicibacterium arseniciresistens]|uniref:Serine hydrolase domain-containing protein n=1 Tax=Mycolicibacterium arseniciresistens TaxID=3062257 RepID=A0ABT8URN1_9MYCO|nr:serine hydrolase domain-containing protein [Mycolicibacterium arseniciresistens]MDO3639672.1 serine hydrolase domain-containing protein [Mycolicibacterium arseniciresistens]
MTRARRTLAVLCALTVLAGCAPEPDQTPQPAEDSRAAAIRTIVRDAIASAHLKAVLVRVTEDGREIVTDAFGESMTGVPATAQMHFRNGAVAISYVATLLLILVDRGTVRLEDRLSTWLPEVPHAGAVTLGQLAQMTSGYRDYVIGNDAFTAAAYDNPFRAWTTDELLRYAVDEPLLYEPGTNWNYAHTNYVLLGMALEKATGRDMPELLADNVLQPLGLTGTTASLTAEIPDPVLHAFSSERRAALGVPAGTAFYEESTFWNPSWTITHGAVQTSTIGDLARTAEGIGSGQLLSEASYRRMTSTDLRGRTRPQPGCSTCFAQGIGYTYGLGVVISGEWLLQNPLLSGSSAVEAYLPERKLAVAVAVTYAPEAFDDQGDYANEAEALFRRIGAELAPEDAPPMPPPR